MFLMIYPVKSKKLIEYQYYSLIHKLYKVV